jgi:type II secretion system protein G
VRQRLLEARRRESGFTLIELLIVIVILGVLAAVVVLAVGAFNDRGEAAACKSDVKSVEVAVEAYRAKRGTYPTDLGKLVNDPDNPGDNYLRSLPNIEPNSGEYWIEYEASTGTVTGRINNGEGEGAICAGGLPTATAGEPGGGTPSTSAAPSPQAPGAVTGLSVSNTTQNSVTITWSAPSGSVTNYTVQWSTNSNFNNPSTATPNAPPHTISGLSSGTNYYIRVAANNEVGSGPWTQIQATTWSSPSTPNNVNVNANNCTNGSGGTRNCTATWNASSGVPAPEYDWEVVRRTGSGSSATCNFNNGPGRQTGTTSSLSVQMTGLSDNQTHCFHVRARNAAGQSNWSSTVTFTP